MTVPKKKSAAKSGDARQPRLQDITRLEEKCDRLEGQVELLIDLQKAATGSPFAGLSLEHALCGIAFAMTSTQPGGTSADYMIAQRVRHAIRGLQAVMSDDDSLLQDKPKKRERVMPGGIETTVQPSANETHTINHSLKQMVDVVPPNMPVS
jgi:hypothetical protein